MVKAFTSSRAVKQRSFKLPALSENYSVGHCALIPRVRKSSKFTCGPSNVLSLISPPQSRVVYIIQRKHVQGISHFASKCLSKYDTISKDRNILKEFNIQLLLPVSSCSLHTYVIYFPCASSAPRLLSDIISCSEPEERLLLQR